METQDPSPVLLEKAPPIAWVTLNRPAARNALDCETVDLLADALEQVSDDPAIKAWVLTGAGDRAFCAGADLKEYPYLKENKPEAARQYEDDIEALHRAIEDLAKPSLAAINGPAIGGGCLLALACDLRVASSTARFRIPIAHYGYSVSGDDIRRLTGLVGTGRSKWLLMADQTIDAAQARDWGLVEATYEEADFERSVKTLASQIANGHAITQANTKRQIIQFVKRRT